MGYYPNPIMTAERYEEQGPESPTETFPQEKAFYEDMERTEVLERKLSKRKSGSGTSIWSRRSFKRSTIGASILPTSPDVPRIPSKGDLNERAPNGGVAQETDQGDSKGAVRQLASSRSVIVDIRESPAWLETGAWAAVPLPTFKVTYPLHNPLGPRRYRNHHLIPPSQKRPSMRPPTFFSPSFPPMHTSSSPEHAMDDSSGPSRTPADSPLPTPTSSQTRVADGGKTRSRKTSQTTPDNVDLLDLTDPWGQNWHHQSPYDFGQAATTSTDAYEIPNRTRRASMTAMQSRHNPVTPSPLSQSTSAVHLHPLQPEIHVPRKLSKRRTPTADAVFNQRPPELDNKVDKKIASAPPTPIERVQIPPSDYNPTSLPKRMSVGPPPASSALYQQQTSKKEKRGSMLNRLVRKFSILRKSVDDRGTGSDYWQNIDSQEARGYPKDPGPPHNFGRASPEKNRPESLKRVPPPSFEQPPEIPVPEPNPPPNRLSLSSLEASYSMGRLTIANPDQDIPAGEMSPPAPPPPEKVERTVQPWEHEAQAPEPAVIPQNSQPRRTSVDVPPHLDKPLPPPQIPTPHFSVWGLPELETPKVVEQPLPPPPPVSQHPTPQPNQPKPLPIHTPHETSNPQPSQQSTPPQQRKASGSSDVTAFDSNKAEASLLSAPLANEIPRRSSSQLRPVPTSNDLPAAIEAAAPGRAQSPPLQSSYAQYEIPQKTASHSQRPSSSRKTTRSPDAAQTSKHERAVTTQPLSTSHHHYSPDTRDRPPESSSNRHASKQSRHQSRSESTPAPPPKPKAIPFPSQNDFIQPHEASPLSTSSILANPPTPYDMRDMMLTPDLPPPPPLPPKSIYEGKEGKKAAHNPSPIRTSTINPAPVNPSPSRQTETFKLVRSSSGHVYASGQTITAAGQQWEVVESIDSKGRKEKSFRPKDPEHQLRDREQDRRSRDHEHKYGDNERKSRDYDSREAEVKVKEREHRLKDHERRADRKSRDYDKAKDSDKTREYEHAREYERSKDYGRPKDYERPKDYDRPKDYERSREYDRPQDYERPRDYDRPKDYEKSREYEKSKDYDRPKDYERTKDPERSKDHERSKDYERSRDYRRSKDRELPKEPESSSRRELKDPKPKVETVDKADYHRSSHRASKAPAQYPEEPPKSRSYAKSPPQQRDESSRNIEKKSTRKREEPHDRRSEYRQADAPPFSSHRNDLPPHPIVPIVIQPSDQPHFRLERNPSLTARPTSELPSAAEMNAMRAKESWEMERLWKARSMYGLEPNAPTTNVIRSPGSSSSRSDDAHTHSAVHGSSHTAYVLPTPFQGRQSSQIYHSMPTAPPPIVYSSPASIPSIPDFLSSYDPYEPVYPAYQPSPVDYRTSPAALPHERPSLNNPLPEPPRESPFNAKKASLRPSNKHSNEYWTKYNGITTAH